MDVRNISNVFVLKDCATTNGAGDTINGNTVNGVQVHSPLQDDGTVASTYFGNGELVITDSAGRTQTSSITKAVEDIVFNLRNVSDDGTIHSKPIKGINIKDYVLINYKAPSQQVVNIETIPVNNEFSYILRIRRNGSIYQAGTVKTISFKSNSSATSSSVAQGLVDAINNSFNNDTVLKVSASKTSTDGILIEAKDYDWELGKFSYTQLRFTVELVSFDATITDNLGTDLTVDGNTYKTATLGSGTYKQIAELEYSSRQYTGAYGYINRRDNSLITKNIPINANSSNTYDTIVIHWKYDDGDFSKSIQLEGDIILALPVENNNTNQVTNIVTILDKYIVIENGIGTSKLPLLS